MNILARSRVSQWRNPRGVSQIDQISRENAADATQSSNPTSFIFGVVGEVLRLSFASNRGVVTCFSIFQDFFGDCRVA